MSSAQSGQILYLSRADVDALALPMAEVIAGLEAMFEAKGKQEVEMPPKPGIHPQPDAFIHAMPAYIPAMGAAGLKWVSGFPANQSKGLPYIHGLVILNDPETGVPLCVMDATWITAIRTGAATAVAAKYLARPESRTVGILACGVQGQSNLRALAEIFELERVHCFDAVASIAQEFCEQMSAALNIEIVPVSCAEEAVRGMDLVVTSGPIFKEPTPVIEAGWMAPGSFACPVDFDSYFTGAALLEADILVTDDHEQFHYYKSEGYFQSTPQPEADLGELAVGTKTGRSNPEQRCIAINLGLALEDMATAIRLYERARAAEVGRWLEM